ncbi:MAG: hypothetical protein ACREMZ_11250 [Gemmatimonadales bacterium]
MPKRTPEQLRDELAKELRVPVIPDDVWAHADRFGNYVTDAVEFGRVSDLKHLKDCLRSLLAVQQGRRPRRRHISVPHWLDSLPPGAVSAYDDDHGRAVIVAHPRVPARDVMRAYRGVQRLLLMRYVSRPGQGHGKGQEERWSTLTEGRNRQVSEKTIARFRWIGARRQKFPDEKWRVTMAEWNRRCGRWRKPDWRYKPDAVTNFIRDYRRAQRYLELAPLEWAD